MTTRVKLVCNASTSAMRASAFPSNDALDPLARQKLAVSTLRPIRADRCFTSPALRATQTAEALKLDAVIEPMLADCDYGRWTGQALDEVQRREPEAMAEWLENPGAAPHGGESMLALMERAAAWLDAQKGAPGMVVAITHASVIRAAIVQAIEAQPRSFWRIDVAPLSLTRLSFNAGHWTLASIGPMHAQATEP